MALPVSRLEYRSGARVRCRQRQARCREAERRVRGGDMSSVRIPQSVAIGAGLLALGVLTTGCSSSKPTPAPRAVPELWGELKPVVSVKELMRDMIDPASDNVFDAVKTVVTKQGIVETEPKTEKDWEKIRVGAVTLAEGVYLLKIPRPFAPA